MRVLGAGLEVSVNLGGLLVDVDVLEDEEGGDEGVEEGEDRVWLLLGKYDCQDEQEVDAKGEFEQ